ncbi:MAG: B12-binding domain-containing radical SAM protein [Lentimicrobiaceae bacterium]|jgi:anaerobic magnesium-protoporphyrin IX monomethyl ester cyclase|nr:B12-binding domain-containing radical SAM protein [Candidatus Scalindua sp.]MBT6671623.1 B12-binding domain-containing radical SAM protein [Lentimicrobiaceae bacterium]
MNVLLVFPFSIIEWNNKYEEPRIPLNITYLAAATRKAGHNVNLMDLRVEQQKRKFEMPSSFDCKEVELLTKCMEDKIIKHNTNMVGINCLYSGLFPVVIHLANHIKTLNPKIKISIGGIHPTIYTKEILTKYDVIDYVIIGEGECSFVNLLNSLSEDGLPEISSINGIGYREADDVVVNPKSIFIENLDELAFPAADLLNIPDYFSDTTGWHNPKGINIKTPVPIITSRSCPKMCNFCSMHLVHGRVIRYRSAMNVVEEMKFYINNYGLHYFNITDDNLTINKKKLIELMDLIIKEDLNIQFSTENGVFLNSLDEEMLDAMSKAGLARLHMAFETGSDYIRNEVIGKNLSNKKIYEIRDIVIKEKYNHIFLYGYFVIGLPEETEETLGDTYQLITSFPLDNYSLFYPIPFPGTKLYNQCLKDELFTEDYFYDPDLLVCQVDVGQMVKGKPNIKPYNLELSKLSEFKQKMIDYLGETRSNSSVPMSSPLRFKQHCTK